MYALITGGTGFVGPYLRAELESRSHMAVTLNSKCNITVREDISRQVGSFLAECPKPGDAVIFHLAALSHVGQSWVNPDHYVNVNVGGTVQLLNALAEHSFVGRLVFVSSAEVYGNQANGTLITEAITPSPLSPYAASKAAAETFVLQYQRAFGFDAIITRPFNHIGPNQADKFLVAAIAKRVVEAQRLNRTTIDVGNLSAIRDFLDVRDVVAGYVDIAECGKPGEVYNICSGVGIVVKDLVEQLIALSGRTLSLRVDPDLVRPVEVEALVGSNEKLVTDVGFTPRFSLDATLKDVLEYWQGQSEPS